MDDASDLTPANRAAFQEIKQIILDRLRAFQKHTKYGSTRLNLDHKRGDVDLIEFGGTELRRTKELVAAS